MVKKNNLFSFLKSYPGICLRFVNSINIAMHQNIRANAWGLPRPNSRYSPRDGFLVGRSGEFCYCKIRDYTDFFLSNINLGKFFPTDPPREEKVVLPSSMKIAKEKVSKNFLQNRRSFQVNTDKRFSLIFLILLLCVWSVGFSQGSQPEWQKFQSDLDESEITSLLILPAADSSIILAGTQKGIYRSVDDGVSFTTVLQLSAHESRVNSLYTAPIINPESTVFAPSSITNAELSNSSILSKYMVFAATDSGVFVSCDLGVSWKRIFNSSDPLARHCRSVLLDHDRIYVGTEGGLFYGTIPLGFSEGNHDVKEILWRTMTDLGLQNPKERFIASLSQDLPYVYIANNHEVFRLSKQKKNIKKIFSLLSLEADSSDLPLNISIDFYLPQIKQIQTIGDAEIYLITTKGIFRSLDSGEHWDSLNAQHVLPDEITSLVVLSGEDIWVSTYKGVFRYKEDSWISIYKGMETNHVNFLVQDVGATPQGHIYAATDRGIFFINLEKAFAEERSVSSSQTVYAAEPIPSTPMSPFSRAESHNELSLPGVFVDLKNLFRDEPTINHVQEMAIHYAEVHPEKIRSWRTAAQKRAWLPNLSVGTNRGDTELFHWDTGSNPDVLARGRDYLDWSVSLSWNLGDLVWNPDQTSIDSRSKLMVELREDIVDQVTRIYFERRRLQMELASVDLEDGGIHLAPHVRLEKELRLEELTALIDGLTAGQFSQKIKNSKGEKIYSLKGREFLKQTTQPYLIQ